MGDLVAVAWYRYSRALQRRPLRTKALTAGVLGCLSDVVAQRISGAKRLQLRRTALMGLYGFFYTGPSAHFVHKLLDRIFAARQDTWTAVRKVLVEQLTYGPICNLALMYYVGVFVDRQPVQKVTAKIERDFWSVQKQGWKLWPLVALVNYKFVPIRYRVLLVNVAAIFWVAFMILRSKVNSR